MNVGNSFAANLHAFSAGAVFLADELRIFFRGLLRHEVVDDPAKAVRPVSPGAEDLVHRFIRNQASTGMQALHPLPNVMNLFLR